MASVQISFRTAEEFAVDTHPWDDEQGGLVFGLTGAAQSLSVGLTIQQARGVVFALQNAIEDAERNYSPRLPDGEDERRIAGMAALCDKLPPLEG